jgi:ABC-type glycerol-3-phosphate transport system substrate-binding protein
MMMIFLATIFFLIAGWYLAGCPGTKVCPFFRKEKDPPKKVYLSFIGPWDSAADWGEVTEAFRQYKMQEANGYIDVNVIYEQIDDNINYEEIIKERQFDDEGPNIFMLFHTWMPRYEGKILPVPETMMTLDEFKNTYAYAAVQDLTAANGTIYALPFYVDTLALYYNTKMFLNESILEYPRNWIEFENYVEKLTYYKKDASGKNIFDGNGDLMIDFAGAAFGGGSNVNRSQDIVMLLVMQNNYDEKNIVSFKTEGAENAIKFYIDFTDPKSRFYTWSKDQMFSIDAFTQRKAAMMVNYSKEIPNIQSKTGGTMDYKIAPLPQLDDRRKVNYASYWVPVVASKAPCAAAAGLRVDCYDLAWEFLNFASQKTYANMYLDKTNRAAANLEIAREQSLAGDARSVFASQVFTARSWINPYDSISDEKLLEMINQLIANKEGRQDIDGAMTIPRRYISEINR